MVPYIFMEYLLLEEKQYEAVCRNIDYRNMTEGDLVQALHTAQLIEMKDKTVSPWRTSDWDGETEYVVRILAEFSAENSRRISASAEEAIRNRLYHVWNRIARLKVNNDAQRREQENLFHAIDTARQRWGPRVMQIPSILDAWNLTGGPSNAANSVTNAETSPPQPGTSTAQPIEQNPMANQGTNGNSEVSNNVINNNNIPSQSMPLATVEDVPQHEDSLVHNAVPNGHSSPIPNRTHNQPIVQLHQTAPTQPVQQQHQVATSLPQQNVPAQYMVVSYQDMLTMMSNMVQANMQRNAHQQGPSPIMAIQQAPPAVSVAVPPNVQTAVNQNIGQPSNVHASVVVQQPPAPQQQMELPPVNHSMMDANRRSMSPDKWGFFFSSEDMKDGRETKPEGFLARIRSYMYSERISEPVVLSYMNTLLRKSALDWWLDIQNTICDLDSFERAFRMEFLPENYQQDAMLELASYRQTEDMSLRDYLNEFQNKARQCRPYPDDATLVSTLKKNMTIEYQRMLISSRVNTYAQAKSLLREYENKISVSKSTPSTRTYSKSSYGANKKANVSAVESSSIDDDDDVEMPPTEFELCIVTMTDEKGNQVQRQLNKCFNCGELGHRWRNCQAKRTIFCMYCGQKDVTVRTCTKERCQNFYKGRLQGRDNRKPE